MQHLYTDEETDSRAKWLPQGHRLAALGSTCLKVLSMTCHLFNATGSFQGQNAGAQYSGVFWRMLLQQRKATTTVSSLF